MEKYSLDTVCTGNHKSDHINSRIMELADDIATELAQKDWEADERPENFWIEEVDNTMRMNSEAQEIWNEYYDKYVDILYAFTNRVIEIDSTKK